MMYTLSKSNKVLPLIMGVVLIHSPILEAQSISPGQAFLLREEFRIADEKLGDSRTRFEFLADSVLQLMSSTKQRDKATTHATFILERAKIEMAIPFMVGKIDLQSYYMEPRDPMASTEKKFVTVRALHSFGSISIPALMDCISIEKEDSLRWTNAMDAVTQIANYSSQGERDAFFYKQANRYDAQEHLLRYLAKNTGELLLQENLVPKTVKTEAPVLNDEKLRSCFQNSLMIWKDAPKAPVDLPIGEPLPPEPIEVPIVGAPSSEQIEQAIAELGDLRCEYAIPALHHRLDFKITRADDSFYFPAVMALSKFGENAAEPLVWQLSQPYQNKTTLQNGVCALVNITGSEANATEALLKGADEAKRRAAYIRGLVKGWREQQNQ